MDAQIHGTVLPVLEVTLNPGDTIVSEAGEMSWMSQSIEMTTTTQTAGAKGVMGVLKRAVAGGGIFMTEFRSGNGAGSVSFATKMPGQILPVQVTPGSELMIQRSGFLCATEGVELTIGFQKKLGAGIFGGEGFILQRLEGSGEVFIHSGGTIVQMDLKQGEKLKVDTGCLVALDPTVDYDIEFVGGIKTAIFGGEGLFFAVMTGPGRVWVQTLPFARLADRVMRAQHGGREEVRRGGALGAIGDLISGDD